VLITEQLKTEKDKSQNQER